MDQNERFGRLSELIEKYEAEIEYTVSRDWPARTLFCRGIQRKGGGEVEKRLERKN
jgi:hypothetical protein